jgi:hypothetical protein
VNVVRCALFALVAAVAAPACGGGAGAGTDAGPDGDAAPADAAVMSCDPAAQDCAAGSKCDFGCQGTAAAVACRADNGSGALGDVCSAAMPCAKGAGCLTTADAGSRCLKYCAGDGDCLTTERCHNVDVTVGCGGPSPALLLHVCY